MIQSSEVALVLLLPCAPQECMWGEEMSERMIEGVRILIAASVENETSGDSRTVGSFSEVCSFYVQYRCTGLPLQGEL